MVLLKWLEVRSANGGRFKMNQLLFADDTTLVADSAESATSVVSSSSEFDRVCEEESRE